MNSQFQNVLPAYPKSWASDLALVTSSLAHLTAEAVRPMEHLESVPGIIPKGGVVKLSHPGGVHYHWFPFRGSTSATVGGPCRPQLPVRDGRFFDIQGQHFDGSPLRPEPGRDLTFGSKSYPRLRPGNLFFEAEVVPGRARVKFTAAYRCEQPLKWGKTLPRQLWQERGLMVTRWSGKFACVLGVLGVVSLASSLTTERSLLGWTLSYLGVSDNKAPLIEMAVTSTIALSSGLKHLFLYGGLLVFSAGTE